MLLEFHFSQCNSWWFSDEKTEAGKIKPKFNIL